MLAKEWECNGFCPENYSGITGEGAGSPHYNWGMLMGMLMLEELVEYEEKQVIFGNPLAPDGTHLNNILADGKRYSMIVKDGRTEVYCGTELTARSEGRVYVDR